jgi:hypothetical protein
MSKKYKDKLLSEKKCHSNLLNRLRISLTSLPADKIWSIELRGTFTMENLDYEFSQSQNELISDLAAKMRFVSMFLIGLGVLATITGLVTILRGGFSSIISGVVYLVIGIWTNKAASSFKMIVETQGNDIENLMGALGELRKLYTLQYWLLIIALVFIAIGLVLAVVGGIFGTLTR